MSKYIQLLRDDQLLIVNRRLAVAIGLDASITLRQVVYWMDKNRDKEKQDHFIDNRWWCYNKYDTWREDNFPFWSISAIRRNFATLEGLGLVLATSAYNKIAIDKTKWYTVDLEAYEQFMALWEEMGAPACGNGGKPSSAYQQFLEAWKRHHTSVHCEQSSVHSEHSDCSSRADHESTVNKAIPENSTYLISESKEKESSSSDEITPDVPVVITENLVLETPTVPAVEEKRITADPEIKESSDVPKPDIADIAQAHINEVAKPKRSKVSKSELPMLRADDPYKKSDWELVLSKGMNFSLTKSGCQRMVPYIRFFNGTCEYKPKKGESEYNLYQCNGDIGGDGLENVAPLSLVQVVALTLQYRAWREPNNKEKQATIYLPQSAKTLQEKCRNFLADADYEKWMSVAKTKLDALLKGESLDTKPSNGTRFDNLSAPKPEDYKRPDYVEYTV